MAETICAVCKKKQKKKNPSKRGKRGENKVVELLREYWGDERFMRNWIGQSGAIGTMNANNKHMPKELLTSMTGDIISPPDFPFSAESKYYEEIDLYAIMRNPETNLIAEFWKQCRNDAKRVDRLPLVIFHEERKQPYAIFNAADLNYLWMKQASASSKKLHEILPHISLFVENDNVIICAWSDFVNVFTKQKLVEWKLTK